MIRIKFQGMILFENLLYNNPHVETDFYNFNDDDDEFTYYYVFFLI
jgi:hypothetical protein